MADNKVIIDIEARDKASKTAKTIANNMREMGEKVSQLGMRMGAAFTLPIVGAALVVKNFGAESAKAFDEAAGDLSKLSPEVIRAAQAYKQMQASIKPVMDALDSSKAEILAVFARVLKDMSPYIIMAADGLKNMVAQFVALPTSTQNVILGFIAFAAIAPIVVTGVGQILGTLGLVKGLLIDLPALASGAGVAIKGLGAVMGGVATGPMALLIAGVLALKWLFDNGWVDRAITAFKQLAFLIAYAWSKMGVPMDLAGGAAKIGLTGTKANGGGVSAFGSYLVGERGPEILNMGASSGSITPNHQISRGGGGNMTFVYSPLISTASTDDIERMGKFIQQAQRRRP